MSDSDALVTISTAQLAYLIDKARQAGWEQGAGYIDERYCWQYLVDKVDEVAGVRIR